MGVDDAERARLVLQICQDAREHDVLDDIGEAAGVKGVAVVHGKICVSLKDTQHLLLVMLGLVPGIHVLRAAL